MDLIRQYISQCISSAANNLRLNTEKIEVVALIRESLCQAEDLEQEIRNMKKVTELSKFAIRLGEVYSYIAKSKIDFFKISDKIKEHTYTLIKDLSEVLDKVSPHAYRKILISLQEMATKEDHQNETESAAAVLLKSDINAIPAESTMASSERPDMLQKATEQSRENDKLREEIIMEPEKKSTQGSLLFENYEEKILTPIKEVDAFLKKLSSNIASSEEIDSYYKLIWENAELSKEKGFDIIAGMHKVFARTLKLINENRIVPDKDVISGMRAALIVVVAVVRGKEVDITAYLNKAEELGKRIQNLK